jgi:hypothetical protein
MTQDYFDIIESLQKGFLRMEELKGRPEQYDGRAVSIALTHLETAMLWLTNALKSNGA